VQHRQGQDRDQEVGRDVESRVAPPHVTGVTPRCHALRHVPQGIDGNTSRYGGGDDPGAGYRYDADQHLGGEANIWVG
jgi:hypothetical protein